MVPPQNDIPDFDLIRCMSDQEDAFDQAREAWGELYVRHCGFLRRICRADHGYYIDDEVQKELVNEAFMKAFDRATTFDYDEACDSCTQERKCRGWLSRILENIVRDRFRGQKDVPTVDVEDIESVGGPVSKTDESIPESDRLRLLKLGLDSLSDTEQTILRATMAWWRPNTQHQRMPKDAMLHLSRQVNKSPATIRQIRLRAIKKLESFVKESLSDEQTE
jgi:RNA polymerase sigma factor (sigma-70 family)